MVTTTITGTMVRSRTPGQRGGVTNTITNRDRTQAITWTNFEEFHLEGPQSYQNVTITLAMDMENAKTVDPLGERS